MWPMLLDYTKDESKRILRRLELEAYASIISAFRAQGDLCREKKKILQDLQQTLSISTERHRAEVRRAINDEKLATIADTIAGTMSTSEWQTEGRRLVPLMPRLVPQTAYTAAANQAASAMMEKNATLPPPSQTWNKEGPVVSIPKPARSASPNSNVVVLPSGTSIHIKGMLNQDEEEDLSTGMPLRRSSQRSLSSDSQNASSVSTQTPRITYTTSSSTLPGSSPVKITISKSPQSRPITVQSNSQPPKVILVTSAGPALTSAAAQRSVSVPMVRAPATTMSTYSGAGPPRPSILVPGVPPSPGPHGMSAFPGALTPSSTATVVSTNCMTTPVVSPSVGSPTAGILSPSSIQAGFGKVRPRLVPRQRYPSLMGQQKPGVVIPMGPQLLSPSSNSMTGSTQGPPSQPPLTSLQQVTSYQVPGSSNVQMKTVSKPTIQLKQEGGMKIITQSNASKILPKPTPMSTSGGPPMVMVNASQSNAGNNSGVTLLPRSVSSYTAHPSGKVLNITTPGGRVIATTTKATNVVTVNPKTLHLTAVKSGSGSTTVSKPNVIVVQKTQHPRSQIPQGPGGANIRTITTTALPGGIDKELMGIVHKDAQGRHVLTASSSSPNPSTAGRAGERRVIITTSGGSGEVKQPVSIIHRGRADSESQTSSLLAELIQAAGIMPPDPSLDTAAQSTDPYDFDSAEKLSRLGMTAVSVAAASAQHHSQQLISRLPIQLSQPHDTAGLTVLDEINGYRKGVEDRRENQESELLREQVLTLEQAVSLLSKEGVSIAEAEQISTAFSVTAAPATQPSFPNPSSTPHILHQPKVSILPAPKVFVNDSTKETRVITQTTEPTLAGIIISPEEGLKEGQLDTQTGLFCQLKQADKSLFSSSRSMSEPGKTIAHPALKPVSSVTTVVIQADPAPTSSPTSGTAETQSTPVSSASVTTVVIQADSGTSSSSSSSVSLSQPQVDLLSSSLAHAQINLDSYTEEEDEDDDEYEEEDELEEEAEQRFSEVQTHHPVSVGQILAEQVVGARPGMAEVLREETAKDGTRILTVTNPASSQQETATAHCPLLVSLPSQLSRSTCLPPALSSSLPLSSSLVTIHEMGRPVSSKAPSSGNTLTVVSPGQLSSSTSPQASVLPIAVSVEASASPAVITLKLDELTSRITKDEDKIKINELDGAADGALEVEQPENLDNFSFHQDSFLRLEDSVKGGGGSDIDSHGYDVTSWDHPGALRSSKRKRKHPSGVDDTASDNSSNWMKTAASLLLKIARFKGSPRDKNEIPAAEWFSFPVDRLDAPDYYTVIQTPMDFSTMRKKLENGQYSSFEDFQLDMELIKSNCYRYNGEGTQVRKDCDEVMVFYKSELAKLQDKHTANKVSSPTKRTRLEEKTIQKPAS